MAHDTIVSAPVEDRDRGILENNEEDIVDLMDSDRISKLLIEKGVIDSDDRKQILLPQFPREKNKILLAKLLTRGPDAFKNYLNALSESRTKNHSRLYKILQNHDPTPTAISVEEKLADSRHKRITEKIESHERRITVLEEGIYDSRPEDDVESIRGELNQRQKELEELRQKLKTRDGELQEAREENKALQKRIQILEKKITTMETYIKEQKSKLESLQKQQQQDRRCIKAMEEKNSRLESKMETAEKKMEKLQDQEKRHQKDLEDIKHLLQHSAKLSGEGQNEGTASTKGSSSKKNASNVRNRSPSCSRLPVPGNSRQATTESGGPNKSGGKGQSTANGLPPKLPAITPKNRFQSEQSGGGGGGGGQVKVYLAPKGVQTWKKSSVNPDKLTTPRRGDKRKD